MKSLIVHVPSQLQSIAPICGKNDLVPDVEKMVWYTQTLYYFPYRVNH